jgi:hypothetical protein
MQQDGVDWQATVLTNLCAPLVVGGSEIAPLAPLHGKSDHRIGDPLLRFTKTSSSRVKDGILCPIIR